MIIAIANQKGGVGKTTTAVNLAQCLALRGKNVLLIDFDVQGHAARCLGIPKADGLFRLLVAEDPLAQVMVGARTRLELVPSDKSTEKIKVYLVDRPFREFFVAAVLEQAGDFDFVILDLAPGSDVLHVGALVAADWLIVPAKLDFLALDGVLEVLRTRDSLARIPNVEPPQLIGVLPTLFDRQTNETLVNLGRLRDVVGTDAVLPPIPIDTHVREATSRGLTIWEYAPTSPAAIGYADGGEATNSEGRTGGYLHLAEIVEYLTR